MTKLSSGCARLPWMALLAFFLCACQKPQTKRTDYSMGEPIVVGKNITYAVIETAWKTQLGEGFQARTPENRFLLIRVSITNASGKDVSIPLLTLEGSGGKTYREVANGEGVNNWLGVLRTLTDTQTAQGNILFDVPLTSYKLRLPDVTDSGFDGYALVQIPLQINPEVPLEAPIDPGDLK